MPVIPRNVKSIKKTGSAALTGDVTLSQGTNVTLTQSGNDISIASTGGTGDVVGPASATDNAVVRFDSTTGKLVQNSVVTIADSTGNMAGVGTLNTHTIPGGTSTLLISSNIGSSVQAYDADLTTWAGITPGANVGTFLATPSSANLLAAITNETGTGALVFADGPTLSTPTLGVATATTVNKLTITAPETSATLTIANSRSLTISGNRGVAYAKYDFSVDGGTVGTKTPATNSTIPDNSILVRAIINSTTAVTSGGAATVAIGVSAGGGNGTIKGATGKASYSADALLGGVLDWTGADAHKMTASGSITFTIGTANLTGS